MPKVTFFENFGGNNMKARLVFLSGEEKNIDISIFENSGIMQAKLNKELISNEVDYIDFLYDYFTAKAGDSGYFVWDAPTYGTVITKFSERKDNELVNPSSAVSCYGWNQGEEGIAAIVTGMHCDFGMVCGVKENNYYLYPRFYIDGDEPYEDICIEFHKLNNGSYAEMAKVYREYQLEFGGCVPLKERVKRDARLAKSIDGIYVRIRQAWKPVPSPVAFQTSETEPELYVACTFSQVTEIAKEFSKQGIKNAEFCLVGWNKGGHDGAFPQIIPVEPKLGGEVALRKTIKEVQSLGYSIVCHDNASEAYYIADNFDKNDIIIKKDGTCRANGLWGGGLAHKICPECQYKKYEPEHQLIIKDLGFEGIHYIDTITIVHLMKCYHKNHSMTKKQAAEWYLKIMKMSRENFGGFSSEGNFDFAAEGMDFALYERMRGSNPPEMGDKYIPFFDIAYHGIISYNLSTETVNYSLKSSRERLMAIETNSRPAAYFYSRFMTDPNANWMGKNDFTTADIEQIEFSTAKIKQMAEDYDMLKAERFEYIENHEEIGENIYRTTYSNGTVVTVDYNNESFDISRK